MEGRSTMRTWTVVACLFLLVCGGNVLAADDRAPVWSSVAIAPGNQVKSPVVLLPQKGELTGCRAGGDPNDRRSIVITADVPPASIDTGMGTRNVMFAVEMPVNLDLSFATMIDIDVQGNGTYGTLNIDLVDANGAVRSTGIFSLIDRRWRNYRTAMAAAVRNDATFDASQVRTIRLLYDTFSHPASAEPFRVRQIRFSVDDQMASLEKVLGWIEETSRSANDAPIAARLNEIRSTLRKSRSAEGLAVARKAAGALQQEVIAVLARQQGGKPVLMASASALESVDRSLQRFASPLTQRIEFDSAGNEYESVQVLAVPAIRDPQKVRLSPDDLVDEQTGARISADQLSVRTVHDVFQHPATMTPHERVGDIPDLLMNTDEASIDGESIGRFWVTLHLATDQPAGVYTGTLQVIADGKAVSAVSVSARVRSFSLPATRGMMRQFNYWGLTTAQYYGFPTQYPDDVQPQTRSLFAIHNVPFELIKSHVTFLLEYRLDIANAATLAPFMKKDGAVDFSHFDELIDLCRSAGQRCFVISESDAEQPEFIKPLNVLMAHMRERGLFDECWIYVKDEPYDDATWTEVAKRLDRIREYYGPEIKTMLAAATALDSRSALLNVTLMRPFWADLDRERVRDARADGQHIGQYLCLYPPGQPHLNYFITGRFVEPRLWEWLNWHNGVDETLYWAVNYWHDNQPGTSPLSREWVSNAVGKFNGDGKLVYPGKDRQLLASIRLESIRDGIEDYEYLRLLQSAVEPLRNLSSARAFVKEADELLSVKRVIHSPIDWNADPQWLLDQRAKIAEAIEKAHALAAENRRP